MTVWTRMDYENMALTNCNLLKYSARDQVEQVRTSSSVTSKNSKIEIKNVIQWPWIFRLKVNFHRKVYIVRFTFVYLECYNGKSKLPSDNNPKVSISRSAWYLHGICIESACFNAVLFQLLILLPIDSCHFQFS